MKITFISDTHTLHNLLPDLPGGDLIIHAGDISSRGWESELDKFFIWYSYLRNYDKKVFIAGNHDIGFEQVPKLIKNVLDEYHNLIYLQDESFDIYDIETDKSVKLYGSPWQPEFCNWAFNMPRNGAQLQYVWNKIPENTDILITHGPLYGKLDVVDGTTEHLGCELLAKRVAEIKPKIHVFGHIHSGHGYVFDGTTHFINASVLNERYEYVNKPITVDWTPATNELKFL